MHPKYTNVKYAPLCIKTYEKKKRFSRFPSEISDPYMLLFITLPNRFRVSRKRTSRPEECTLKCMAVYGNSWVSKVGDVRIREQHKTRSEI